MDSMVMHPEVLSVTGLPKVVAKDVNVFYGDKHALKDVSVEVPNRGVMSFIGPSGCGKSTFLRCINRMNDTIPSCRVTGNITIDDRDIYDPSLDVVQLRARVGGCSRVNPFRSRSSITRPTARASTG